MVTRNDKDGEYADDYGVFPGGVHYTVHSGKPLRTLKSATSAIALKVVGTLLFFGLLILCGAMNSWLPMLLSIPIGVGIAALRK